MLLNTEIVDLLLDEFSTVDIMIFSEVMARKCQFEEDSYDTGFWAQKAQELEKQIKYGKRKE